MTPNRPLQPPLRGAALTIKPPGTAPAAPVEADCTYFECDQCGRAALRPHAAEGRIYCRHCCPTCARAASATNRF
jgi:hypothetical protein